MFKEEENAYTRNASSSESPDEDENATDALDPSDGAYHPEPATVDEINDEALNDDL